jgi:hypothetical protein
MTGKQQKEYYKVYKTSIMEKLGLNDIDFQFFKTIGNKLNHIYCLRCNGYIGSTSIYKNNKMVNEYTDKMYKRDTEPLYKKAELRAKLRGLYIFFQTDPRGATIYLSKEPIPENSYTVASCIY